MSDKHKIAMNASQKGGRFDDPVDAYLYAVGVFKDALLRLEAVGIAPNEQCDALGYTLINLLTTHYSEELGLLLFETLQSTLRECYEPGLRTC